MKRAREDSTRFCFAKHFELGTLNRAPERIRRVFASKNRTELLPQLPSLKTVHRTVFLTLRPTVLIPCSGKNKKTT